MTENKNHWYDGLFYDLFIAPHQDQVFAQVKEILAEGSTLLDVGCGTGRLASQLLDKCDRIVIIDPSERNIDIARKKLAEVPAEKLLIEHADALEFILKNDFHFDFAIVSYVLHEIREEERDVLLWGLSGVADKIIIVEYLVPQPRNYCGLLNELVEYAAGTEHYGNFKSFVKGNGIAGLLEKVPLKVVSEVRNQPCSSHIAVLEGKTGRNREAGAPHPIRNNTHTEVEQRRLDLRQTVGKRVCF
jgi:SAM-dependent methyltransferase